MEMQQVQDHHTVWHRLSFRTVQRIQTYSRGELERGYDVSPGALPHAWDAAHWVLRLWGDQRRLAALRFLLQMKPLNALYLDPAMIQTDDDYYYSDSDGRRRRMVCLCIATREEDIVYRKWWLERDFGEGKRGEKENGNGGLEGVVRTVVMHKYPSESCATRILRRIVELKCIDALSMGIDKYSMDLSFYDALNDVAAHHAELQSFQCTFDDARPEFIAAVKQMTSLTSLSLGCRDGSLDVHFVEMLPKLEQLSVATSLYKAECSGLDTLAHNCCPQLSFLRVYCSAIQEAELLLLTSSNNNSSLPVSNKLSGLRTLDLTGIQNLPAYLSSFFFIGELRREQLRCVSFASCTPLEDVNFLSSCTHLREVDLSWTGVTTAGIAGLAACRMLEKVNLYGCEHIHDISVFHHLEFVSDANFSQTAISTLGKYGEAGMFPALKTMYIRDCWNLTDVSVLASCPLLERVELNGIPIETLGSCVDGEVFPELRSITIQFCGKLMDVSVLASCPKLQSIYLQDVPKLISVEEYRKDGGGGGEEENIFHALQSILR